MRNMYSECFVFHGVFCEKCEMRIIVTLHVCTQIFCGHSEGGYEIIQISGNPRLYIGGTSLIGQLLYLTLYASRFNYVETSC